MDTSYTKKLLDLLQKQSYYAGKLSAILEVEEEVSRVELPEESKVLNERHYYYSNKGEEMVNLYNAQGFYVRDGKKIRTAQKEACKLLKEIIDDSNAEVKKEIDERIETFGISPSGIPTVFCGQVIDYIAMKEELDYDDVLGMLDICRRLGLISQLNEFRFIVGMDKKVIENMMYGECVSVMQRLEYSDSYDLARDVYTYSNFNLEDYDSIVEASLALGDNFDQGIDNVSKDKVYVK